MLEQYIGYINRLCFAADVKKWTEINHSYDLAYDTVGWYRILRECYWA